MKKWFFIAGSTLIFLIVLFMITMIGSQKEVKPPTALPTPTAFQKSPISKENESIGRGPGREFIEEHEKTLRDTDPALFLNNKLPYISTSFSMISHFNRSISAYRFTIALKGVDPSKSKTDALSWMRSLGLTDKQIQPLSIEFHSEATVKLKEQLPYSGKNFAMFYEKDSDKTTVLIYNGTKGEQEFDAYLKANGISDRSLINNLTILYR